MKNLGYTKNGKVRNSGMFTPGVSGNPAGRPKKDYRMTELARQCSPDMLMALFDIAMSHNTNDSDRIRAIGTILDRAYGKAT